MPTNKVPFVGFDRMLNILMSWMGFCSSAVSDTSSNYYKWSKLLRNSRVFALSNFYTDLTAIIALSQNIPGSNYGTQKRFGGNSG